MKNKNDGGPAFPTEVEYNREDMTNLYHEEGMSLRDYFAGQAMQSIIKYGSAYSEKNIIARYAYEYADAMLEARDANSD